MAQKSHPLIGPGLVASAALMLGGCPAPGTRSSPETRSAPAQALPPAPPTPPAAPSPLPRPLPPLRENRLSPATQALAARARNLLAHGDLDGASSSIDRALRIEPSNPLLWIELGRVRLAQNDAHQAETSARKALALASGDRAAQAQAVRVLADALRAQGRNQDAHEIEGRPYMLR